MKELNFIATPSAQQHKQAQHFIRIALASCILMLGIITFMHYRLYRTHIAAKKQLAPLATITENLETCLNKKNKTKQKLSTLKAQLAKTSRIRHTPKNPKNILQTVLTLSPTNGTIQAIHIKKKIIDLHMSAPNTQDILHYASQLQHNKLIKQFNIQSMEPQTTSIIQATLSGVLA